MPLEKLRLKLDSNDDGTVDNTYDIYPVQTLDLNSRKDAFSISPPDTAASNNILFGFSGMQADISMNFTVWDDGVDRANGTHTSTVVTVEEQLTYLEGTMHAPDFEASWQIDHLTGGLFSDDDVYVETIEPTLLDVDSPKWKPCRMGLRRGGSV